MSAIRPDPAPPRRLVLIAATVLLLVFATLSGHFAASTSPTFDEPDQVGLGYAVLAHERSNLSVINLRLSQIWAALPLLAFERPPVFPSDEQLEEGTNQGVSFGRLFYFANGNDTEAILFASRAMIIVLGLVLGGVLFVYSRRLHGDIAGLLTLVFYSLSPLVIANSAIATTEMATTLLFTLSVLALWRLMHRISVATVLGTGFAVGALAATKISGLLIVPIALILLVLRQLGARDLELKRPRGALRIARRPGVWLFVALLASALSAWAVVWAVYGGPAGAPPIHPEPWKMTATQASHFATGIISQLREWRLLPDSYLYDLHQFVHSSRGRRSYFLGEYSLEGWRAFFPVAWLVKNPVSFLLALVVSGAVAWQGRRLARSAGGPDYHALAPLFVLAVVYGAFAVMGNLNIGVRHLLPLFPFAFVWAGLAAKLPLPNARLRAGFIAALLGGSAMEAALIHPQYIAYFNFLAGGPERGWRVLSDSSADWGESLPRVRSWLERRAARGETSPVYISYFGNADLAHYGINDRSAVPLPQYYETRYLKPYSLGPGDYVLSTTMLNSLYSGNFFGPWRESYEKRYQESLAEMSVFYTAMRDEAALKALLERDGSASWIKKLGDFDYLRFSRLCAYLRQHEPDERVSYGMVVYHLDAAELHAALIAPPVELGPLNAVKGAEKYRDEELDFAR